MYGVKFQVAKLKEDYRKGSQHFNFVKRVKKLILQNCSFRATFRQGANTKSPHTSSARLKPPEKEKCCLQLSVVTTESLTSRMSRHEYIIIFIALQTVKGFL